MNDLSNAALRDHQSSAFKPIPSLVLYILVPIFFLGLSVSIFILIVVRNALFFVSFLVLSALVFAFVVWNKRHWAKKAAFFLFLNSLPESDLRLAQHGQLVKITGKSGLRATVKAGSGCKVIPLVVESKLVNTKRCRLLSPHLRKWLSERNLSSESRLLRLEEGYVQEGSSVTVFGMLHRNNEMTTIVQPPEVISTGCLWRKLLLPVDIDGLILRVSQLAQHSANQNSIQ